MTLLLLLLLGVIAVVSGLLAAGFGAGGQAWVIGAIAAVVAEILLCGVRARVETGREVFLPGAPEAVFKRAVDPSFMLKNHPAGITLKGMSGDPGVVGSSYVSSLSGLVMRARVVESDPPNRIVTETRTRLNRTRITRDYAAHEGGTRVQISTLQHLPLAAWLALPLYAREVRTALAEVERQLRQALLDEIRPDRQPPPW